MILNLCYRGKQVKETIYKIMLQETVWTLSNTQRHLRQASIIKRSLLNRVLGVLGCVACLACLRASCLVCLRACVLVMMKCFMFLRVCVLACFFVLFALHFNT